MVLSRGHNLGQPLNQRSLRERFVLPKLACAIRITFFLFLFPRVVRHAILIDEVGAREDKQRELLQVASEVAAKLLGWNPRNLVFRDATLPEKTWIVTQRAIGRTEGCDRPTKPGGDIVDLVRAHMLTVSRLDMRFHSGHGG